MRRTNTSKYLWLCATWKKRQPERCTLCIFRFTAKFGSDSRSPHRDIIDRKFLITDWQVASGLNCISRLHSLKYNINNQASGKVIPWYRSLNFMELKFGYNWLLLVRSKFRTTRNKYSLSDGIDREANLKIMSGVNYLTGTALNSLKFLFWYQWAKATPGI